jgi:hypothetical protein
MFRKIALIGLISISSLYGEEAPTQATPRREQHHQVSLWFKAIIPSILSYASMEWIVRANKDNPDRQQLVTGAKHARWLPAIIGTYCLNIWMDRDLKEWMLRKPEPSES